MPSKEEKRRRRELSRALAARERAEAESQMPIKKQIVEELLNHIEQEVFQENECTSCDHTLKQTMAFLKSRDSWSEEVRIWLGEHGGYCDCEVVYNVGDWLEGGF